VRQSTHISETPQCASIDGHRDERPRERDPCRSTGHRKEGTRHDIASCRIDRITSRSASVHATRARPRWAAVLAIAYLAVAGCAAQADNANHAASQPAMQTAAAPASAASGALLPPPSQLYGDLFVAVQTAQLYPDQKTFVDATPNTDPATIVQLYQQQKSQPGFSLKAFVDQYFTAPPQGGVTPPANLTLRQHIDWLWPQLTRTTTSVPPYSSLVPMPKPYVVPGGRFREGYYWDTYFTMLGLQVSGREDLVDDMLDNFAYLIDTVGHIPNGNRTYYASRSQPPFFAYMVTLAARAEGDTVYQKYRRRCARSMRTGCRAKARRRAARPCATWSRCRTARCSIATGMRATRRATSRISRT
jgi:alpha,alpha-trehalase